MCFGYSTPMKIAQGLKCVWNSQMGGKSYSSGIIKDVDMALKALEIVYHATGAVVDVLANRNGHRRNEVGVGKSFSWGDAQTKGEGCKCKLAKIMFFHNHLLQLCMRENGR